MTILNAQTLPKHGPNIEFAALPSRLDIHEWPAAELYREHTFFEWPDDPGDAICSLTHTYLFFDLYGFTQYHTPEQIYGFASKVLNTSARIAACPVNYFHAQLRLYENSTVRPEFWTRENLKADMVETLLYIAGNVVDVARNGKCLAILSAITDFASHPPENRCVYRDRHSYQQLAGAWLSRFHDECRQKDFSLSDYLVKLAGGEKRN